MQAPTPWGSRHRVRALYARGWDAEAIERESGVPAAEIERIVNPATWRGRTRAGTDGKLAMAYRRLADLPAPGPPQRGAERWPVPAAWDDEMLDVQGAKPDPGWRRRPASWRPSADIADDVQFLREWGGYRLADYHQLADRLGMEHKTLQKALARNAEIQARAAQAEAATEPELADLPDIEAC